MDILGLEQGEITYEPSDTVEAGKIISTDPSTSEVPKGTKINFVVSEVPAAAVPPAAKWAPIC
mgnify:CR=1 FL=1